MKKHVEMNCPHPVASADYKPHIETFYADSQPVVDVILSEDYICRECGMSARVWFEKVEPLYKFQEDTEENP